MNFNIIYNNSLKSRGTYSKFINIRPLFFLCGPYLDENNLNDRREILRKFLGNIEINSTFHIKPYALVIDNLFPPNQIDLNLTLIEEIISVCSYMTFVFLDTMSTSLEMGLFVNSQNSNSVVALLPNDYQFFRPKVGFFVDQTMEVSENIKKIKYPNKRVNKYIKDPEGKVLKIEENLIAFNGKKLPKCISQFILNKEYKIEDFEIDLNITNNIGDNNKILFQQNGNYVRFKVPTRILFFLVNNYHELESIKNFLMEHLKNHYFYEFNNVPEIYYLFRKNKVIVEINSSFSLKIETVIKNIEYLIMAIESKKSSPQKYKNLQYFGDSQTYVKRNFNFTDIFGFNTEDWKTIKNYLMFSNKYILNRRIRINGKYRKITMYKNNEFGFNLRDIHNRIVSKLQNIIEENEFAYAYKKNISVLDCVVEHIDSKYFLKLDIQDFFNSISKQKFVKILKCNLSLNPDKTYINNIIQPIGKRDYIYESSTITSWDDINLFTSSLFYKSRLPLGYTSSPLISNIYLNIFDKRLSNFLLNYNEIIFTRYADDILISSKFEFDYEVVMKEIEKELSFLGLKINAKKTKKLIIKDIGDHVKYLGVNIVKRRINNEITIGKKYIYDLIKQISKITTTNYLSQIEEVKGKINYIVNISPREYELFKYIYKIKNNCEFSINNLLEVNIKRND